MLAPVVLCIKSYKVQLNKLQQCHTKIRLIQVFPTINYSTLKKKKSAYLVHPKINTELLFALSRLSHADWFCYLWRRIQKPYESDSYSELQDLQWLLIFNFPSLIINASSSQEYRILFGLVVFNLIILDIAYLK